jgi:hypothetical protein
MRREWFYFGGRLRLSTGIATEGALESASSKEYAGAVEEVRNGVRATTAE